MSKTGTITSYVFLRPRDRRTVRLPVPRTCFTRPSGTLRCYDINFYDIIGYLFDIMIILVVYHHMKYHIMYDIMDMILRMLS